MLQLQSLLGLIAIPLIAWGLSERRSALAPSPTTRLIAASVGLQIAIAGLMLNVPLIRQAFDWPGKAVAALQGATNAGMRLVFGYLAGGPAPYASAHPENTFILAFHALPMILLVSVLSKLLYHWGILQRVVDAFAWGLNKTLGVSGPVGTSAAANIFLGMVEAPLLIKPYIAQMSRSGLFATMTVGMAGIAGTVLAVYASLIESRVPGAAGHLIVASVISVPAALMLAQLMVPETESSAHKLGQAERDPAVLALSVKAGPRVDERASLRDDGLTQPMARTATIEMPDAPQSSMDAVAQGTREGVDMLVNVTAMLVVAVALVALANMILGAVTAPFGAALTFEGILGWLFAPLAWLLGIPWREAGIAGGLLGVKTVLNEFVAFLQLTSLPGDALSPRSRLIMTYALCGFANLGSLGIMIGGLVAMVPARRPELVTLGAKTIVSGTLATLMTAAVVGLLTPG